MQHYHATLTERGQVTLPMEIRRMLGVRPNETVTFEVEGNSIRVVPSKFTVERVRGSVPALAERASLEDICEIAGDEHARDALSKMDT